MARQLADRRARQFLDELDGCGQLVLAELAGEERTQLIGGVGASTRPPCRRPGRAPPPDRVWSGPLAGGGARPGEFPVRPQPLFSSMPTLRSKPAATSTGSGAPPEPALRSDEKSRLSRSGSAAIAIL